VENINDLIELLKNNCMQTDGRGYLNELEERKKQDALKFKGSISTKIDSLMAESGVPKRFLNPKSAVKKFDLKQSYYIYGGVGTGKTDLAAALLREILLNVDPEADDFGHFYIPRSSAVFVSAPAMFLSIRSIASGNETSELDIVKKYAETRVLILDDLGTEKLSDWVMQTLYVIINKRYENVLQTIITSNFTLQEIKDNFHEGIASRIKGMCEPVELKGQDRRYVAKVIGLTAKAVEAYGERG
jgi:DNA replication protein DnaC